MSENDPRHWGQWLSFNPAKGTVVREPPGEGPGYWAGAPGVTYHRKLERFYMVYRLRRPRGLEPDRGAEIRIAYSRDGVTFQDVWSGTKDQLGTSSIERCALVHLPDGGWRLYPSYVDPADGRWMIGLVEAEEKGPAKLILNRVKPEMVRRGDMLTTADVLDVLAIELIGVVPEDDTVLVASNHGSPAALDGKSRAGRAFRDIARRLNGETVPFEEVEGGDGLFGRLARMVRSGGQG